MATMTMMMPAEGPPSYESIMEKCKLYLASNPPSSPQKFVEILKKRLNKQELELISRPPSEEFSESEMTKEQKEEFYRNSNKFYSDPASEDRLKFAAKQAADACKRIDDAFINLGKMLTSIDKSTKASDTKFVPELNKIRDKYRKIIGDSHRLALDIATYAKRFDQLIIPLCSDKKVSRKFQLEKLDKFIKQADSFDEQSQLMYNEFTELKDDVNALAHSFNSFAINKSDAHSIAIRRIDTEIKGLQARIDSYKSKVLVADAAFSVCSIFGVVASVTGPLGTIPMIASLCAAGVCAGFALYYYIQMNALEDQVKAKQKCRDQLQAKADDIARVQSRLDSDVKGSLSGEISNSLTVLGQVWKFAQNDAHAISQWLDDGKEFMDAPLYYRMTAFENATGLYRLMSIYLQKYADGVASAIPK